MPWWVSGVDSRPTRTPRGRPRAPSGRRTPAGARAGCVPWRRVPRSCPRASSPPAAPGRRSPYRNDRAPRRSAGRSLLVVDPRLPGGHGGDAADGTNTRTSLPSVSIVSIVFSVGVDVSDPGAVGGPSGTEPAGTVGHRVLAGAVGVHHPDVAQLLPTSRERSWRRGRRSGCRPGSSRAAGPSGFGSKVSCVLAGAVGIHHARAGLSRCDCW